MQAVSPDFELLSNSKQITGSLPERGAGGDFSTVFSMFSVHSVVKTEVHLLGRKDLFGVCSHDDLLLSVPFRVARHSAVVTRQMARSD